MPRFLLFLTVMIALTLPGPDGARAQFGSNLLRAQSGGIERAVSRNLDRVFKPKLVVAQGATGPVTAMALSEDEHYLITAVGNNTVRVWDLWVGREIARLSGHGARITDITVARDSSYAVTVAEDHAVKAWNLKRLGEVVSLKPHDAAVSSVAIGHDGTMLLTAAEDGVVRVWTMPGGTINHEIRAHSAGTVRVTVAPDGGRFVTGGADGMVRVWDTASGQKIQEMAAKSAVTALTMVGERIAAGTRGGEVRIWKTDGTPVGSPLDVDEPVAGIGLSGDGTQILTGDRAGKVRIWPTNGGDGRTLGRHDRPVTFAAISREGTFAMTGSEDGTTRLWNVGTGAELLTLISTETGWAVVDAKGRYDGNQQALAGIEWQDGEASSNIDDFSETHYQAALLPRTLRPDGEVDEAASIPNGVRFPPKVRLVQGEVGSRNLVVEVMAEDNGGGGVSEIRLYRNGKLVPEGAAAIRREEVDGRPRLVGRYDLDTSKGRTVISATAVNNERLESRPESLTVGVETPKVGTIHLLTVGINTYQNPKLNLYYAKPDAQAISDFFVPGGRAASTRIERIELRDQQATKAGVLAAIRSLRSVPTEDMVIVYLAGHGVTVKNEWYFISHEISIPKQATDLAGMALSSSDVKAELEALNADRTVLLIDTCQSGTLVSPIRDYRGMKALRLLARSVGTHVLAATDRDQSALELERLGHGIFTYTLLQGMTGEADVIRDGVVSATELIRYVEDTVPKLSMEFASEQQYPTGYSRGIDFGIAQTQPGQGGPGPRK